MKLVLSIDGGGIRGLLPARLLQAMQGASCYPEFDMIAGNSTGGILACGLVSGVSAKALAALYSEHGSEVFSARTFGGIVCPKYNADALESFLKSTLGSKTLKDADPELLVPSYCVQLSNPETVGGIVEGAASWFFKSWDAKSGEAENTPLWQVARATSAAPTFFPTAKLNMGWFVDGGMFANNPALCAYADAISIWYGQEIKMLSIGTGAKVNALDGSASANWGAIEWAPQISSVFMDGAADATTYILDSILGPNLLRCETPLIGVNDAFDDASAGNIANLETLAEKFVSDNLARIKTFINVT